MFVQNEDHSIYVTRGDECDILIDHAFKSGDVVRFKVTRKKDCNTVMLQRDFTVSGNANSFTIHLEGNETKLGEVISKPTDYWYEVELNPDTDPNTIIGYDEDGAKILRLYPEGKDVDGDDIEVVGAKTLQELVDYALAEAKASGEFNGDPGHTPIKGVDYWTEEDIEEIKSGLNETVLGDIETALDTTVKSVNGIVPDKNGNVQVETGDGGMTEEQAAQLEALNETVFETVIIEDETNKLNPNTTTVANFAGTDYYKSDVIPAKVGDIVRVYENPETHIYGFKAVTFGVYLVDASGAEALPTLSIYHKYTIEEHPTTPNIIGFKLMVKKEWTPADNPANLMVTINEDPAEFHAWSPGEEKQESRVQKNTEQIANLNKKTASRWSGKNVLVFGDSISADYYAEYTKWATVLKDSIGCNLFNYSVHGFGYVCGQGSAAQGECNMINQIENANNDGVNPDLIILFMGTNDFGNKVPIGTAGDGTNLEMYSTNLYLTPTQDPTTITTFYGGVEHCMARIKQLWANALVCVLTPLQRTNQTSATPGMALVNYRDIIEETAKRFAFPVKDLYHESNFSPCNPYDREAKTYQLPADSPYAGAHDGLHPNEAYCREVLAPMIGRFIENI